ncbi:TetR/AcrR family transcriptional regulator [Streptomyces sp. NPDC096176]|uniref:TetR/AcrR family transcriptional regulator n=1 Tax=Streptomyces sp. NPDC096176 TaxID=3366079 RepID=UPI0038104648
MAGRRDEVLNAAIAVLAAGGLRRLTYQAVDGAAGVPAGTTSNHFRNRDALVDGVVAHLEKLDRRDWESFAGRAAPHGIDELAAALARMVEHLVGPARDRTSARYALLLEGLARPSVRVPLVRGRESLVRWGAEWLAASGSPDPEGHCRVLFDLLEGMMFHQVTLPDESFRPERAIRTALRAFFPEA